eukprot:TRINITY_DN12473_c0_g1_i1.p1 TRINITY_DN12473_c0_g1~~TRINITY_DN12473_c0_g1_i1.p1  ORF type:complete len:345 (+),score=97.21 TRINITY_DN12473_c0_g1_i1:73-1107(+)
MSIPVQKTIQKTKASTDATATSKGAGMVVLPADFTVDKEKRFTGTCNSYSKWRGFGHIELDEKGVVPGDSIFIHWKNIQSDDRFPRLKEGLKVEFGIMISMEWKGWSKVKSAKAKTVTLPGGGMINIQDEMDAADIHFVGAQNLRYSGQLKFFDSNRGFGWVAIDDGFAMDEVVPKEIKVQSNEVNCGPGGRMPRIKIENLQVEFGIMKNKKGEYNAYNMTLPQGLALSQENLEHRQEVGGEKYAGVVSYWNWRQGWGHIQPDATAMLPPAITQKLDEMVAAAAAKALATPGAVPKPAEKLLYFRKADSDWSFKPDTGKKVFFTVYIDDKGAGAKDVVSAEALP